MKIPGLNAIPNDVQKLLINLADLQMGDDIMNTKISKKVAVHRTQWERVDPVGSTKGFNCLWSVRHQSQSMSQWTREREQRPRKLFP